VSVHLLKSIKSYCLPYLTYACEALPFTKPDIYRLDNLIVGSLCRIFNVYTKENIDCLRHYLNVRCLSVVFESRKQRFMDKLIDLDHFNPILRSLYWSLILFPFFLLFLLCLSCVCVRLCVRFSVIFLTTEDSYIRNFYNDNIHVCVVGNNQQ